MSLNTIFQISAQAMTAQRERLEAATANLANSNTTRTSEGGPYRRRDVVFEALPIEPPITGFNDIFVSFRREQNMLPSVRATSFTAQQDNGVKRYQPDHPDADSEGYLRMPDVDPLEEMVNVMSASRAFEASATVFNTAKEMIRTSLKLSEA